MHVLHSLLRNTLRVQRLGPCRCQLPVELRARFRRCGERDARHSEVFGRLRALGDGRDTLPLTLVRTTIRCSRSFLQAMQYGVNT